MAARYLDRDINYEHAPRQSQLESVMLIKLTLRLDATLIERAKSFALEQDRSLSQLVADYFSLLTAAHPAAAKADAPDTGSTLSPITSALRGALRETAEGARWSNSFLNRNDYRAHLDEKHRCP